MANSVPTEDQNGVACKKSPNASYRRLLTRYADFMIFALAASLINAGLILCYFVWGWTFLRDERKKY